MPIETPFKLAYLVSHPIQYQAPLLRKLAAEDWVDLKVFFISGQSTKQFFDPGFNTEIKWDVPLLDGYEHEFLPAIGEASMPRGLKPLTYGIGSRLSAGKFDALWLHGYAHPIMLRAIIAAKMRGIKVLLRAESQSGANFGTGLKRAAKDASLFPVFKLGDAFLTVGSLNAQYYRDHGVPDSKLFSVPYAVDNDYFQSRAEAAHPHQSELRASLGLDAKSPIILFASKLETRKKCSDLVSAFEQASAILPANRKPYLLIVGDGIERKNLEAQVASSNLDRVHFLGFRNQTELPALYDMSDVFVLPSAREMWGLIVNEVMNAAKPVIITDEVGSHLDLVKDGVNGYVYRTGDIPALANHLVQVLEDPSTSAKMGQEGLRRINEWGFDQDIAGIRAALEAVVKR